MLKVVTIIKDISNNNKIKIYVKNNLKHIVLDL